MKIFTKEFWQKLLWKRCPVCNEKKKWFFYTWEFPMSKACTYHDEACQECAINNKDNYEQNKRSI